MTEYAFDPLEAFAAAWVLKDDKPPSRDKAARDRNKRRKLEPPRPMPIPGGLTERERDVLVLVACGLSNEEIGRHMFLSPDTVQSHRKTMYAKLGVVNSAHAGATAARLGLV